MSTHLPAPGCRRIEEDPPEAPPQERRVNEAHLEYAWFFRAEFPGVSARCS